MASHSGSKTPTKQRNFWTLVEEKEFLILCRKLAIAEQLDNCVTSAGVKVIFCFNSIELKGFSIRNFADEKYKGGNCEVTVILRGRARFLMINNQIRRKPFIRDVRVLCRTRIYKWYSSRPI